MAEIILNSVSVKNEQKVLFKNLNLQIPANKFTLVTGPKSAGKYLLLKIIGGILKPDSGTVTLDGIDIYDYQLAEKIDYVPFGFIFQNGALISNLNVEENLLLPLDFHFPQMSQNEKSEKINYYLQLFSLDNVKKLRPSALSADILKVIGVIRAFIVDAKLIIMNEPLDNCEPEHEEIISGIISEKMAENTAFIMVSRNKNKLDKYVNYVVELKAHDLVFSGNYADYQIKSNVTKQQG